MFSRNVGRFSYSIELFVSENVSAVRPNREVLVHNIDNSDISGSGQGTKDRGARQFAVHVFPLSDIDTLDTKPRFKAKYVLAPTDTTCETYLPAQIIEPLDKETQVKVKFHRDREK